MNDSYEMTASRFCEIMGAERHSLSRKMNAMNCEPVGKKNGGKLYRLKDLVLAYAGGDERAERIRKTRAEALRLEIQNERSQGELVSVALVKQAGEKVMAAVRTKILNSQMTLDEQDSCLQDILSLREVDFTA